MGTDIIKGPLSGNDVMQALAANRAYVDLNCPTLGSNAQGYSDVVDLRTYTSPFCLESWADQASATNGCRIEASFDNSYWFLLGSANQTTEAALARGLGTRLRSSLGIQPLYIRLNRTNGASALNFWKGFFYQQTIAATGFVKGVFSPTLLAGGATYTSPSLDAGNYDFFSFLVVSDQASAANGVVVEASFDNLSWYQYTKVAAATTANVGLTVSSDAGTSRHPRYLRLVYINGSTLQTKFFIGYYLCTQAGVLVRLMS